MSNQAKLPYWYLFQDIESQPILEEEIWRQLIEERLQLLSDGNRKNIDSFLNTSERKDQGMREIQAFTIMKIGVCLDPRLSSWLVETEGDLFENEFRNLKWAEKMNVLNHLYPETNARPLWMTLDDLSIELEEDLVKKLSLNVQETQRVYSKNALIPSSDVIDARGMNKFIALDFRYASLLVKSRRLMLYKGWAIAPLTRLVTTIKHHYESKITDDLTDYAHRLEETATGPMKRIAKKVNEDLQERVEFKRTRIEIGNLEIVGDIEDNMSILPPCIEDLLISVQEVGYIGHWERLQLGIFLKKTGMNVDDQLSFWYSKAVDNVNMTFDDFLRKAGYVIRHIYGLEGGHVDYEMPSCSTIQNKMYCTFRHRGLEQVNKRVLTKLKAFSHDAKDGVLAIKKIIAKRVLDANSRGLPSIACGYHLEMMSDVKLEKIHHPLIYLKRAGEKLGRVKEENKQDDENKGELNNE